MSQSFACPACGASIEVPASGNTVQCPACQSVVNVPDGAANPDAAFMAEIQRLARSNQKIEAIKLYRGKYQVGLAEAKAAVEACERGNTLPTPVGNPQTGAASSNGDPAEMLEKIRLLANSNQKIEAIKLYRAIYPVGLADAKSAVEALVATGSLPDDGPARSAYQPGVADSSVAPAETTAKILQLVQADQKIEAIKLYRALYEPVGLKEAKDAVEALQRTGVLNAPASGSGAAAGPVVEEVSANGGVTRFVILVGVVLIVAGVVLWLVMH